jgi:hypothetical protein
MLKFTNMAYIIGKIAREIIKFIGKTAVFIGENGFWRGHYPAERPIWQSYDKLPFSPKSLVI